MCLRRAWRRPSNSRRRPMGGGTGLVAVGDGKIDAAALVMVDMAPKIERDGQNKIHAFMDQNPNGFESLQEVAEAISTTNRTANGRASSTDSPKMFVWRRTANMCGIGTRPFVATAPAANTANA